MCMEETGSFASSPIPTTTAAVVRNADVLTYPFAGNASATAGTAYAELARYVESIPSDTVALANDGNGRFFDIAGSQASTTIRTFDGTTAVTKSGLTSLTTGVRKRAVSWGADLTITGDGATVATGAFDGSMGAGATIQVGGIGTGTEWYGTMKNVRIWTSQVPNAALQVMTS